ncbi:MAG: indole-3-glycerol-phosphate synthase [Candidatus Latescibacterota bacterium]|nr:MAG: indole-3-glycerol-phosphate synthase [Candidatus Latescibacterota bacterium]
MLEEILRQKRAEVAQLSESMLRNVRPSTRNISYALGTGRENMTLFAELKRRDPWSGEIRPDLDLVGLADTLQRVGIAGLVVDTEGLYWGGSRDDLIALDRHGIQIPIVRNDFIVEELQLYESRRAGADSVLLRVGLLDDDALKSALRVVASMHMVGIVLVYTSAELDRALATDAVVIAISNRDLETGAVDLGRTLELATRVPSSRSVLACFGIGSAADVQMLRGSVDAVCIGSALLQAPDPIAFLTALAGA